ncbi:ras association domain-containing protein 8 isoform X2 [Tursiops truncatus]|uniref:ras association domain-containing protein 8 isoform X2 n=1 Tax=Tursiops truncatus TaxID=9739 RepID=UPI003CCFD627
MGRGTDSPSGCATLPAALKAPTMQRWRPSSVTLSPGAGEPARRGRGSRGAAAVTRAPGRGGRPRAAALARSASGPAKGRSRQPPGPAPGPAPRPEAPAAGASRPRTPPPTLARRPAPRPPPGARLLAQPRLPAGPRHRRSAGSGSRRRCRSCPRARTPRHRRLGRPRSPSAGREVRGEGAPGSWGLPPVRGALPEERRGARRPGLRGRGPALGGRRAPPRPQRPGRPRGAACGGGAVAKLSRTGRYTLIEKWRDTERHLAPHENPIISLNKWGQYASDVQLILRRTGPSLSERPTSDGVARVPERTLCRQSLPPLAKLRPQIDKAIKRREPKRKSLTFTGGAKGLMDIFGKGKETEFKQKVLNNCKATADELKKLIRLQTEKLQSIEKELESNEIEIRFWEQKYNSNLEEEIVRLEQKIKRNDVEIEEEEFWENELQIEQENEKQLKDQLQEIRQKITECESKLKDYLGQIQTMESGLEAEKLQREVQEAQVNEEEVKGKIGKVRGEIDIQGQQSLRLENGIKAVERSLGQATKRLQMHSILLTEESMTFKRTD